MKKNLFVFLIIILMGCSNKSSNQNENLPKTNEVKEADEKEVENNKTNSDEDFGEMECVYIKANMTRKSVYPFNKATKIEVFSCEPFIGEGSKWRINSSSINSGVFELEQYYEKISLSQLQTDSLFSILYNYQPKRLGNTFGVADCYNPRHSIVFYEGDKAIAFIELCLECSKTKTSKGYVLNGDFFCNGQWCHLYRFFKYIGLKKGFDVTDAMCNNN